MSGPAGGADGDRQPAGDARARPVRVTVVRSGGVAGMVLTTTVEAADLDDAAATDLRGLVAACSFADGPPSAAADAFAFEVSVQEADGAVRRTRFGEGAAPEGAGPLVAWVTDGPHGHRRLGRGG